MTEIGNVAVRLDAVITDEQYLEAMGAVRAANERMDLLDTENAELRELVQELWHLVNHRSGYGYAAALEHIEELGIEVNG